MLKLTPEDQADYMVNLYNNNIVTIEEVRATLNLGGDSETIAKLNKVQDLKDAKIEKELSGTGDSATEENTKNDSEVEPTSDKEKTS